MTENINDDKLLVTATLGDLKRMLLEVMAESNAQTIDTTPHTYVYGLKGIEKLFHISHSTAQRWKDTILQPACSQVGGIVIVDSELAVDLVKKAGKKNDSLLDTLRRRDALRQPRNRRRSD